MLIPLNNEYVTPAQNCNFIFAYHANQASYLFKLRATKSIMNKMTAMHRIWKHILMKKKCQNEHSNEIAACQLSDCYL